MAFIKLYQDRLRQNYEVLDEMMQAEGKEWAVVSKLLCGNEAFLRVLLDLGVKEVCDSRIANLKTIKQLKPDVQTVFIVPPGKRDIQNVVRYADISFNTESEIIRLLSEEAGRQGKTHKVVIMIELGDLREGIMGDHLIDFYGSIFDLPNIEVTALGSNFNCLHGVMPSQDKLIQLALYKQLIEATFNQKIPYLTGGASVVLPLLQQKQVPAMINHFRIGETLYFGNNIWNDEPMPGMRQDVVELYAEILEITKKPKVPIGILAANPSGNEMEIDEADFGKESYRAILDVGLLDMAPKYLLPDDQELEVIEASSDMLVIDLGGIEPDHERLRPSAAATSPRSTWATTPTITRSATCFVLI